MRKTFVLLAAVVTMFLGAGVAQAASGTYAVSRTWWETYPNGTPTLVPHIEDDVVEVRCHGTDQVARWKLNNPALNGGSWRRTDGTGIQVEPEWTGKRARLTLTVFCQRS